MAEKSLYSTAIYHHQQALVFKQEGKFDQAKATFESAAKAYDTYLKRFPRSKNAYEMEFYFAECSTTRCSSPKPPSTTTPFAIPART